MSNSESDEKSAVSEFNTVALASLTEAVRRVLMEHQRFGDMVPAWKGDRVVWVDPGENLHRFPVRGASGSAVIAAEQ